ncbi:NADPH-dependent F420 reductase [Kribbella sp. NBC_01484]|uniref:NADPH-dependent F420 reductase n=1 Tax=Kribbella sp. NBC_01484 TaxID=2903579 RepID=UPI003FA5C4BA
MGRGIGTRLAGEKNQLHILAPTVDHATTLAAELGSGATGGGTDDAIDGKIVVLATPYDGALDFVAKRGGDLTGRVVVDITNPADWASFDRLVIPSDSSAAQEIAARLPDGVPVVKAFNTTFAGTLASGEVAGQQLDVLVAADDQDAKDPTRDIGRPWAGRSGRPHSWIHIVMRSSDSVRSCSQLLPGRGGPASHRRQPSTDCATSPRRSRRRVSRSETCRFTATWRKSPPGGPVRGT